MEKIKKYFKSRWVLLFVVLAGLAARMAAASLGYNFDMQSWIVVADVTSHGGNVYAETGRYNYGPVWFLVIHALDLLSGHRPEVLHYWVAAVLTMVDLGIFLFLLRRAGRLPAVLFFLNPISILITGYGCQFENLAILLGLWSVQLLGDDFDHPMNRRKLAGLLVLGVSLMTKHIFFAFPLWLAIKQKGFWQKIIILAVPPAFFLLSFAPYWPAGRQGILDHVFFYHSNPSNFFYEYFVPKLVQDCLGSQPLWLCLLIIFAFLSRGRNAFESLLIYTGVLVAFSPATTNQYLTIPVALAAVFWSVPFALYVLVTTYHLCVDFNGPHFLPAGCYYDEAIIALCLALGWLFWRKQFLQLFQGLRREIELQFGWRR
jgi:uncharacterized protein Usg